MGGIKVLSPALYYEAQIPQQKWLTLKKLQPKLQSSVDIKVAI
ncbi:MAG: hypothetical protein ACI89U_001887 [Gammaproteobacteria bacterium]|jgi:hypothetical protein